MRWPCELNAHVNRATALPNLPTPLLTPPNGPSVHMLTIDLLLLITTFLAGFLLVFGVNLVVTDVHMSEQHERRVEMLNEIRRQQRQLAKESPLLQQKDLAQLAAEAAVETSADQQTIPERLQTMLWQAGMRVTVERLLMAIAICGIVVGAIVMMLTGSVLIAIPSSIIGGVTPLVVVQARRQQRLEQLRAQLPDSFDLMARVLRAGQTISQGMQSVSQEFPPPIAVEFGFCYEQQNLGLNPEVALRDLANRTGLLEIKIFVLALIVHRQTGGNLTELLENLGTIVRDRFRLRGKIKAVTSEGRMQGLILMILPLAVYGVLLISNRTYALKLFDHPWLPITSLSMMGVGGIWIKKIVNFDF